MLEADPPAAVVAHCEYDTLTEKTQMARNRNLVKTLFIDLVLKVNTYLA